MKEAGYSFITWGKRRCCISDNQFSPSDNKEAIHSSHGVKGVVASVIIIDNQHSRRMVTKIPFISQCNNFKFTTDGLLCRKAYDVSLGHFLPAANFKDSAQLSGFNVCIVTGIAVLKDCSSSLHLSSPNETQNKNEKEYNDLLNYCTHIYLEVNFFSELKFTFNQCFTYLIGFF